MAKLSQQRSLAFHPVFFNSAKLVYVVYGKPGEGIENFLPWKKTFRLFWILGLQPGQWWWCFSPDISVRITFGGPKCALGLTGSNALRKQGNSEKWKRERGGSGRGRGKVSAMLTVHVRERRVNTTVPNSRKTPIKTPFVQEHGRCPWSVWSNSSMPSSRYLKVCALPRMQQVLTQFKTYLCRPCAAI